ncbi:MAG: hypothetical protein H7A21_19240 [Spirochaetales bacterium]|nr:hypothetical protein [Leptospiraceae bacterium]MCP5483581.1 hypothetical protein [Spirochaetales bacterium]MCP5486435.1 hypothetical protein [Spirochaetales bacterium]
MQSWPIFLIPAVYFALLGFITYVLARREQADDEYFLAGRRVGPVMSLVSVVATETSVATVILFPPAGLKSGFALVWLCLGYIAGRSLVGFVILPILYSKHRLSIYATMAGDHTRATRFLSGFYLLAKVISSGVRFFLAGVALDALFRHVGLGVPGWIVIMALFAGAYSLTGGLRAVILTDQIQGFVILLMGFALALIAFLSLPDGGAAFGAEVLDSSAWLRRNESAWSSNLFSPVLFLGGLVLSIGSHGADQDLLQRVLATRTLSVARRSLILSGLGATLVIMTYLGVGFLLRHASPGLPEGTEAPLVEYIVLLDWPWLTGSFAVLLFAAAMSTIDSAMHSTGAVWKSVLNPAVSGRVYSALSLFCLTGFALFSIMLQSSSEGSFIKLALGSMSYVNGGLIAITLLFVLGRGRGVSELSILAALFGGYFTTVVLNQLGDPARMTLNAIMAIIPGLVLFQSLRLHRWAKVRLWVASGASLLAFLVLELLLRLLLDWCSLPGLLDLEPASWPLVTVLSASAALLSGHLPLLFGRSVYSEIVSGSAR